MKNIFLKTIVLAGMAAPLFIAQAADLDKAFSTLPDNDEWSIMARAAHGQIIGQDYLRLPVNSNSATDYEKRILAIVAIGENPATFGQENFLNKLKSFYDGVQIGSSSLLNDDIFGLQALWASGERGSIISSLRNHILKHQNSDGGWGFSLTVGSDSNMTAMALLALTASGGAPQSGVNYLLSCQNSDGGFGYTPAAPSDGASTAWALLAGFGGDKARNFLESLQLPDGSFKWMPGDPHGSALVTAYALRVLPAVPAPQPTSPQTAGQPTNNATGTPAVTKPALNNHHNSSTPPSQPSLAGGNQNFGPILHQGTIYQIKNNVRLAFSSAPMYFSHGYKFADARPATADELKLPVICCADWADGSLVNDRGTVYLVSQGVKRGFTSEQSFLSRGYKFHQVFVGDTWWLKTGPVF